MLVIKVAKAVLTDVEVVPGAPGAAWQAAHAQVLSHAGHPHPPEPTGSCSTKPSRISG